MSILVYNLFEALMPQQFAFEGFSTFLISRTDKMLDSLKHRGKPYIGKRSRKYMYEGRKGMQEKS